MLTDFQFSSRPKIFSEYAAIILLDSTRDNVNKGRLVGAIFVDLSKAFDTINHAMLLDKLYIYGAEGKELECSRGTFSSGKQSNNCFSMEPALLTGVRQRSTLGPILSLILFNNVIGVVDHSSILKYAEDTVLCAAYQEIRSINAKLAKDMDCLAD